MDCREEVAILERRLKPLPGLEDLVPDLVGQRLRVRYDAAKLSTSAIVEAVAQTGMRAWLEHEQPVGHTAAATARQALVVVSGIALAAGLLLEFLGVPCSARPCDLPASRFSPAASTRRAARGRPPASCLSTSTC